MRNSFFQPEDLSQTPTYLFPLLGPMYLSDYGASEQAQAWIANEFRLRPEGLSSAVIQIILHQLAELLHDRGRDDWAVMALSGTDLALSNENLARKFFFQACVAQKEGKTQQQWDCLQQALKSNPKEVDSLIMLWELCQIPSDKIQVEGLNDEYRKALETNIESQLTELADSIQNEVATTDNLYNQYAWLAVKTDRHLQQACDYAQLGVNSDPDSAAVLDTLAHTYAALGKWNAAIETQRKAIDLDRFSNTLFQTYKRFEQRKK